MVHILDHSILQSNIANRSIPRTRKEYRAVLQSLSSTGAELVRYISLQYHARARAYTIRCKYLPMNDNALCQIARKTSTSTPSV